MSRKIPDKIVRYISKKRAVIPLRHQLSIGRYRHAGVGNKNLLTNTGGFLGSGRFVTLPKNSLSFSGTWGRFMPDNLYTNMYNSESWVETAGTGHFDHVVKANSIYDPWNALSANSVLGHGMLEHLYYWYQVYSCVMEVEAVNNGTQGVRMHILQDAQSTSLSSKGEALDTFPGAVHQMIPPAGLGRLRYKINIAKVLTTHVDKAAWNSDPTYLAYLHLIFNNYTGAALNLDVTCRLTFRVKCMQLKKVDLVQT